MNKVGFQISNMNLKQNKSDENKKSESSTMVDPIVDEEKSNAARNAIGATALSAIVLAGIGIATKGKLWGKQAQEAAIDTLQAKPHIIPDELNEEGKKYIKVIKQKLDGKITCKVKDKKSNELNELGQYYHIQEMKMNIKKQMIEEGKLNYQIEFKKNKITIKDGEIKTLINEKGDSWQITEATDKEFVKELKKAINTENEKRVAYEISTRKGLKHLEAQEKSVQLKKNQSDTNNELYIKKQHQIKEKEYSNWWNSALKQNAKETFFIKSLETINLRANGLKLNEGIVIDGQKFVFKKGKLEKVLDVNNKEIVMDENINLKKLEAVLSQRYEQKVVVPRLKKQIKNATSIYTENINNIENILKDLEHTKVPENREVIKKLADKEYTFCFDKSEDEPFLKYIKIVDGNGKKLKYSSLVTEDGWQVKDGKNTYIFIKDKKEKHKLICLYRDPNSCNIGDVDYYQIKYARSGSNSARGSYKMPNYIFCDTQNSKVIKGDFCDFNITESLS